MRRPPSRQVDPLVSWTARRRHLLPSRLIRLSQQKPVSEPRDHGTCIMRLFLFLSPPRPDILEERGSVAPWHAWLAWLAWFLNAMQGRIQGRCFQAGPNWRARYCPSSKSCSWSFLDRINADYTESPQSGVWPLQLGSCAVLGNAYTIGTRGLHQRRVVIPITTLRRCSPRRMWPEAG